MFKCEMFTACKLIHHFKPTRVKAENGFKQPFTDGPRPINPEAEEVRTGLFNTSYCQILNNWFKEINVFTRF